MTLFTITSGDIAVAVACYLTFGVAVMLAEDPLFYCERVERAYIARHRRLPGKMYLGLRFVGALLGWPRTFFLLAVVSR